MTGSSFKYLVKEGTTNIWFNRLMSFASIGVLCTCLLLVGFAMVFSMNVSNMVSYIETQNEAVVFVEDKANEQQTEELKQRLEKNTNIFDIRYVSKQQALEEQMESIGDTSLLEGLDEDDFMPATFRIRIKDPEIMVDTVKEIENYDNVMKVTAVFELGETLINVRQIINTVCTAVVVALIVISVVIIANTIRASVFTRRREINIMKYVGATDGFIRLPFIVEGLILGFVAAIIAFIVIWLVYVFGLSSIIGEGDGTWISEMLNNLVPFEQLALSLGVSFAGAGMLTGAIGSFFSIRHHLKV